MPVVDRTRYTGQEKLRELLRRERRVELASGRTSVVRYLPLEIGEQVLNGKVYGCLLGTVVSCNRCLSLTNERIFVENRKFDPAKHYLWPIPQTVIDATPANFVQNPHLLISLLFDIWLR